MQADGVLGPLDQTINEVTRLLQRFAREIAEVFAHLRRLNPVIQGEETGQVFFRFASGATAIWDANRYNEVESPSPRYTFGQLRVDAMGVALR